MKSRKSSDKVIAYNGVSISGIEEKEDTMSVYSRLSGHKLTKKSKTIDKKQSLTSKSYISPEIGAPKTEIEQRLE